MAIFAAGILFRRASSIFLTRRSDDLTWAVPGGKLEAGESPQQAARREVTEECGYTHQLPLTPYFINTCNEGQFVTYLADKVDEFPVILNDENTESGWFALTDLPQPLHPGLIETLSGNPLTETDTAALIAQDVLPSPQFFMNMYLWAIRVTGTGVTWRSADREFTFRNPDFYLNQNFMNRIPGTPVIWEHPDKRTLDHNEFTDRVIGTLTSGYIVNDEVWSIGRIYDLNAAENMMNVRLSTSPTVCLDTGKSDKIMLDGEPLLLEDIPVLLDHVAICEMGVWDKQIAPTGVKSDSLNEVDQMTAEEIRQIVFDAIAEGKKADAEEKAKADSEAEEKQKKADAENKEAEDAKAKADESDLKRREDEAKGEDDKLEAERKAKEKSDAEAEEKAKADSEISALRQELQAVKARIPENLSDSDREKVAAHQVKADSVFAAFGERAPVALSGENVDSYRRRLLNKLKQYSPAFKTSEISTIADSATLDLVEKTIFADAEKASRSGDAAITGLREVINVDGAGRRISTFVGQESETWKHFTSPARKLHNINN